MTKKVGVFLVDDHAVLRGGMKRLIDLEDDFVVCGEASDAAETLQRLPAAKPGIALIDLSLKGTSGLDLIKQLKQRLPKLPILIATAHAMTGDRERLMEASGADGYLEKPIYDAQLLVDKVKDLLK